jgi:hypothetical protein
MTLRSIVDEIVPGNACCPLRQARRRLRLNPPRQPSHRAALYSAAFVAICAVQSEQFPEFSDRIGHVTGLASAAKHSSVASIAVGEPQPAAP